MAGNYLLPFMMFTYLHTFFLSLYAYFRGQGREGVSFSFLCVWVLEVGWSGEVGVEREKTPNNDHTGYLVLVAKFALYFC